MARSSRQTTPLAFRALRAITILSAWLVPLFFLPTSFPFAAPKGFLLIALACIEIPLLVSLYLVDRSYVPKLPKLAWLALAYAAWLAIASFAGVDSNGSFWSTFWRGDGLFTFFAVLTLAKGFVVVQQKEDIRVRFAAATTIGGVILVALKYIGIAFSLPLLLGGGTVGNPSFAAAYLLFPIFTALYLAVTNKGKKKILPVIGAAWIALSPLFINIFGAHTGVTSFLGESRAAAIGLAIGAGAGYLFHLAWSESRGIRISARTTMILTAVGACCIALMLYIPGSRIQEVFTKAASPTRALYSQIALSGIADRPVLGSGWNSYQYTQQKYYDPIILTKEYRNEGWVDKPHNVLFEIGSAAGIPALLLYLAIFSALFAATAVFVRKSYITREVGALFFGLLLAYFIQNLFLFDVVTTWFFFWMIAAWLISYIPRRAEENNLPRIASNDTRTLIQYGAWALAAIGIWFLAVQPAHEAVALKNIRRAPSGERTERMAHIFAISPMGRSADEARIIDEYAQAYLSRMPTYTATERELIAKELSAYLTIVDAHDTINTARLAIAGSGAASGAYAFSSAGSRDNALLAKAKDYALRAIELSPRNQRAYLELAKTYALAGDRPKSIDALIKAVELEPRATEPQIVLLRSLLDAKETDLFQKYWVRARAAIPNFDFEL